MTDELIVDDIDCDDDLYFMIICFFTDNNNILKNSYSVVRRNTNLGKKCAIDLYSQRSCYL